jgi:hypothetical protein
MKKREDYHEECRAKIKGRHEELKAGQKETTATVNGQPRKDGDRNKLHRIRTGRDHKK